MIGGGRLPATVPTGSLGLGGVAAAIVALAAVAGQWTAHQRPVPPSRGVATLSARSLSVQLSIPPEWRRLPVKAARIAGLQQQPTLVFDPEPGLSARAVVTVAPLEPGASPSSVPKAFRDAVATRPRRPRVIRLVGRRALTYTDVPLRRGRETMDITLLPTTAGVVAVACIAPRFAVAVASGCAYALRPTLRPQKAVAPTRDTGFRLRAREVVRRLDQARVEERASLRRARTAPAQAVGARRLSVAHERAAVALEPLPRDGASAEVAAALRRCSRAYRSLVGAASAEDRAAFARAGRAVEEAEDHLSVALAALDERSAPAPRPR